MDIVIQCVLESVGRFSLEFIIKKLRHNADIDTLFGTTRNTAKQIIVTAGCITGGVIGCFGGVVIGEVFHPQYGGLAGGLIGAALYSYGFGAVTGHASEAIMNSKSYNTYRVFCLTCGRDLTEATGIWNHQYQNPVFDLLRNCTMFPWDIRGHLGN